MSNSHRSQPTLIPRPSYVPKLVREHRSISFGKLSLIAGLIGCELILQTVHTSAQPLGTYFPPRNVGTPGQRVAGSTRLWNGGSYRPTGNVGTPTRTQSGATRGDRVCPLAESTLPLVAVVPDNSFGVTIKSHPTFVFNLPAIASGATPPQVEFVIRDLDDNNIYKARFITNGRGGIASITLPETSGVQGLELNKDYRWSVAIICQTNDRGKDLATEGLIQRIPVPPELASNALSGKSLLEQAELLWDASIWYDAAALMLETQRTSPNLSQWGGLLQAVGLRDFVSQPLLSSGNTLTPLDSSVTSSALPE